MFSPKRVITRKFSSLVYRLIKIENFVVVIRICTTGTKSKRMMIKRGYFDNVYQFVCGVISLLICGGTWDFIVLVHDLYLSFYFQSLMFHLCTVVRLITFISRR